MTVTNDAQRHEAEHVLSLVQAQMEEIATLRTKQSELTGKGRAAGGMVEVTVNAQHVVITAVVDESYLDDHEFDDLGEVFTQAAQAASRDLHQKMAHLMAPIAHRRSQLADVAADWPDMGGLTDLLAKLRALNRLPEAYADSSEQAGAKARRPRG
jgi:DNA-binding protein YbaB